MDQYKNFGVDFVKRAGEIMLQHFTLGVPRELKVDKSPITIADSAINKLLIGDIKNSFPDHGVLGEEESDLRTDGSEYIWVCDPIDGTRPFIHGIPIATSSLALTRNGESILGFVYDPFSDRLFVAEKGKGATMNGNAIRVSPTFGLNSAEGNVEVSPSSKFDIIDLPKILIQEKKARVLSLYSVVYASMLVAAGEYDFVVFPHIHAHDAAAVKIIVEEAGGKVTDLFGNDQRYDRPTKGFIASNGKIHQELLLVIQEFIKERV